MLSDALNDVIHESDMNEAFDMAEFAKSKCDISKKHSDTPIKYNNGKSVKIGDSLLDSDKGKKYSVVGYSTKLGVLVLNPSLVISIDSGSKLSSKYSKI